ncbi:sensor histidine kinase [Paenibacillus sp. IB182496]|uniref:Sensor histidine kinase n=1 Tax=Paenibacillus sabuli TaxID=2772509 RepID=A0A927BWI1_9BACL|nr:sensor histidine kinase [Paenibacillus sabuli]MBD2848142.1 sensor histidine kinase [Paenibacillus sabuli]
MLLDMRYFSLRSKLFVLLIVLSLVPAIAVSAMSQYLFVHSSTRYSATLSSQLVEYVTGEIDNYLSGINETLLPVYINSEFQKFLSVPADNVPLISKYSLSFRPLLQLLIQSKSEILSVLYLDPLGKVYSESQKLHIQYEYPFREDPLFQQVFASKKEALLGPHPMRYALYPASERQVITFVKPVIDLSKQAIGGWLLVEIDASWLERLLQHTQLGEGGRMFLIDRSSGASFPSGSFDPLNDQIYAHLNARPNLNTWTVEPFVLHQNGARYQVMHHPIAIGDWSLVGVSNMNEVNRAIKQTRSWTIFVAAVSLLIAMLIAYPIMRIVLSPLYRLKHGMQMLGKGRSIPIAHTTRDEFGFLIRTYNAMLDNLEQLKQEVLQSQLREREKELLQLQAQINPHFLFNTLETIDSYSLHNDGNAVSDMLQTLSRLMRYNVRQDDGYAPLTDELVYIRDFLRIHDYRYGERVEVDIDISDELLRLNMMKLSLQPFVENALKHGWSPNERNKTFRLRIAGRIEEHDVVFVIEDNGLGMPPETLSRLNKMTAGEDVAADPFFRRHTGMMNVHRRYKLTYGRKFTMSIRNQSTTGDGTVVLLRWPRDITGGT